MTGPGEVLRVAAERHGNRTALVTASRRLSYRELDDASDAVAASLQARGVRPDPVRGELACAYVVPVEGADVVPDDLMACARKNLAAYKRPKLLQIVPDLPRTSSGKIMRRELIKLFDRSS